MNDHSPQYSGKDLFGFDGSGFTSTGLSGSSPDEGSVPDTLQHGQLGSGLPGHDLSVAEVAHTGAPGTAGHTPPADGGTVTVTNGGHSGIPDGTKTGTANTSKDAMADPFVKGGSFGGGHFPHDTTNNTGTPRTEHP